MQAFYADKTEIRTLSMDELSLVAGGFNWDKVQWGKAVAVGAVTGLSAGVAGLTGGPGVAAAAAARGVVAVYTGTTTPPGLSQSPKQNLVARWSDSCFSAQVRHSHSRFN